MERIGHYLVEGLLGQGAMGAVYRVRDPRSGRQLALKVLLAGRQANPKVRARFQREVEALSRLDHPGVVRVFDVGDHEGAPYLVMELVPGRSLQTVLEQAGPLPEGEAAGVVAQLALALEHAHQRGVLHRDVKPQNVLLRQDRQAVLVDFGLTRELEPEQGRDRLSRTGMLLGTPGYMAPEQAKGELDRIGPQTDVFGLGATLYAALTGQPPFSGHTVPIIMAAMEEGKLSPPSALRPGLSSRLDAICLRCLRPDPERRYASAGALADDLRAFRSAAPSRSTAPWIAAALAFGGLLGAGVVAWTRRSPPPAATPTQSALPALVSTEEGWALLEAGQLEQAEAAFGEVLGSDDAEAEAWLGRGEARRRLARPEDAARDLQRALRLDSTLARAHCALGWLAEESQHLDLAQEHYERALELQPDYAPAHYHLGGLIAWARRDDRGLSTLLRALELDPLARGVYPRVVAYRAFNLPANAFLARDQLEEALACYELFLAYAPDLASGYTNRAGVRLLQEDYAGASADYQLGLERKLAEGGEVAPAYRQLMEQRIRAYADDARAIAQGEDTPAYWLARAELRRDVLRQPKAAILALDRALARTGSEDARGRARLLFARSELRTIHEQPREKLEELDQALALDPNFAEAYRSRAKYRRLGRDERGALEDYERLVALLPDDVDARVDRGAMRVDAGNVTGGLADLDHALRLDPENLGARWSRGRARLGQQDYPGAIADYDLYLAQNPDTNFGAWTGRGEARLELGDLEGAQSDLKRALAIHDYEPAKVLLARAEELARSGTRR